MSGRIFLLDGDRTLRPMEEEPYDSEDLLQTLLADHPDLLAGDQINDREPRRWLLVRREFGVPDTEKASDRWAVDHLFLDQDGVPTLVEVKRSSDTRIRREVVGQLLDYAAHAAAYWPVERIRATFETECETRGESSERVLANSLGGESAADDFWEKVGAHLDAGRLRLVFVADRIPRELQRVVEFLNKQMDPAEVLAVEIRQFVGDGRRTLVPRVMGLTAEAQERKSNSGKRRVWDEARFLEDAEAKLSKTEVASLRRLLEFALEHADRVTWGTGARTGSFNPKYERIGPRSVFTAYSDGNLVLNFGWQGDEGERLPKAIERLASLVERLDGFELPSNFADVFVPFPAVVWASQVEEIIGALREALGDREIP